MVCKSQAIQNLFDLLHGPASGRKVAAVIVGYFDDSSTHRGSKIFALCGFLADPRIWGDFDIEWKKILDKPEWPNRPREFHMVDCVHGVREFQDWSLAQRLAIFGDMAGVVCDSNVMALGSLIVVNAYEHLSNQHKALMAKGGLNGPMDFVFQHLVQSAITNTRKYGQREEPPVVEELGLVFDEEPAPIAERYHALYDHIRKKHPFGAMLNGIAFGSSEKFTPIQAADMLAYTSYHWQLKQQSLSESDFDFPIIPGFLRLIENVAADGGIFTDHALGNLVAQELINEANKAYRF